MILRLSNTNRTYADDYHIKQYKYLSCLNIKLVLRYWSGLVHRSGPVEDFDRAVWTGPDRPEKINDGPVRFIKLPDRCTSDSWSISFEFLMRKLNLSTTQFETCPTLSLEGNTYVQNSF